MNDFDDYHDRRPDDHRPGAGIIAALFIGVALVPPIALALWWPSLAAILAKLALALALIFGTVSGLIFILYCLAMGRAKGTQNDR
jgi:hypothetical protein